MSTTSFQAPPIRDRDPYKLGSGRSLQGAKAQGGHGHGGGHGGHGGHGGGEATGHGEGGPASLRVVVGYGFWIFLLSDIIMFAAFFAAYAVLAGNTAGGPGGGELFDLKRVAAETALLLSSFTCGMANLASDRGNRLWTELMLLATGLLGLGFFALEMLEFYDMIAAGNGPDRSAFLSSFFALVGLHGLHIFAGGLWLGTMMAQVWVKGFRPYMHRRLLCFYLFWHALDIIWVAIFTFVYLIGSGL